VTLAEFSTGARRQEPQRAAAAGEENWTHATFRFSQKGHPAPAWQSAGFVLSDATGNICSRTHDLFNTRLPSGERLSFRGSLWPGEPACKLRFRFMRRSGFAPAELWTVSSLAVPGKRSGIPLSQQAYRQGATLRLLAITGPGGTMPGNGPGGREPSVQIRMSPPSDDLQLALFRAVDDRGRDVTPGSATLMPDGFLSFELPGGGGAKRVSLTFAVQKPRAVEFVVKPVRS
jgi:hypothetical protein